MLVGNSSNFVDSEFYAKPYCECWKARSPIKWKHLNICDCGEYSDVGEWNWVQPINNANAVVISEDKKQLTFHPVYSSGTAVVQGDTELQQGYHYYWEIKMLTDAYGTDVMIGLGTNKVNTADSEFTFRSILGEDSESYGISYRGTVHHDAKASFESPGFCKGSIVGVRVDLWQGKLEFYVNRVPQGVSFYNLKRHSVLFPMVCSTAAQSAMRLIYTGSWRASLLVDAAKILAQTARSSIYKKSSTTNQQQYLNKPESALLLPPGLWNLMRSQFWLTMPSLGCIGDDDDERTDRLRIAQEIMEMDIDLDTNSRNIREQRQTSAVQRSTNLFASPPMRDRAGSSCRADFSLKTQIRKPMPRRFEECRLAHHRRLHAFTPHRSVI